MGKNVVLCMVSYKPILIAGLIMVVVGVIGISITAPTVIRESVPDTEFNIQSPPTETEFRNPMVEAEIVSIMLVIVGWAVSLYGWYAKTDKKNPSIPS
jgi:hypothetical protein